MFPSSNKLRDIPRSKIVAVFYDCMRVDDIDTLMSQHGDVEIFWSHEFKGWIDRNALFLVKVS